MFYENTLDYASFTFEESSLSLAFDSETSLDEEEIPGEDYILSSSFLRPLSDDAIY